MLNYQICLNLNEGKVSNEGYYFDRHYALQIVDGWHGLVYGRWYLRLTNFFIYALVFYCYYLGTIQWMAC